LSISCVITTIIVKRLKGQGSRNCIWVWWS